MSIAQLLTMEKKNDEFKIRHEKIRQWLFILAAAYILFVYVMMIRGCSLWMGLLLMAGFIAAVYFLFSGLSAFIICRVQKKGKGMYRKNRIFLYRQFASKVHTMRFTMGTLTLLLVCALLGGAFSFMFTSYQGQAIDYCMPFDVLTVQTRETIFPRKFQRSSLIMQSRNKGFTRFTKIKPRR